MAAAACLGEDASLLHLAIELFQCSLKGAVRVHNNLAHSLPTRSAGALVAVAAGLVAVLAIDRTIFTWLERHAGLSTTTCADSGIHRARLAIAETATVTAGSALAAGLFACGAACGTAAGCIGQATAGVKFLFSGSENEFLVAVATIQGLVSQ